LKWIKFEYIGYITFWIKKANRPYAPPSNKYGDILITLIKHNSVFIIKA